MTRTEFENKYLNKLVEVKLFDNDIFKGYLYYFAACEMSAVV